MLQKEIHQYLEHFFQANDCQILENGDGFLTVQLTIDMDKELMNRPFYWVYLEKTNGIPNPMRVTYITDQERAPDDLKGELIHFGAPRLHQLFSTAKKLAGFMRVYEKPKLINDSKQTPLHPWLGLNVKISYQSDRKRDIIKSIGLNLLNGALLDSFQEKLDRLTFHSKISDYCFTISPIIKPESGLNRIEKYLIKELSEEPHLWAEAAIERWDEDLQLLKHFYADYEEKPETYETEKRGLKEQYEPMINIEVINGGMFYIATRI
ncbi:YqhG family protein [Lederbergia lenta]|uniref:YqhG family protein n=1 Tax=Lederbergia lenta TaxID=1467 RepID=UPI002040DC66|nr:YqhG family protein [Lederbergia lenta]MCM3111451.1 YqhG family protein [Lederbergia lenta]